MHLVQTVIGMNSIQITLDTTPPTIEIYAPQYVLNGHYLEFRVTSNEALDIGRYEAKVYDHGFNSYTLTLTWDDEYKEFIGLIDTYNFVNGLAKIEVTIYDEVHNSQKAVHVFTVLKNNVHNIEINMLTMDNIITLMSRDNLINFSNMNNELRYIQKPNNIVIKTQDNSLKVEAGDYRD